jgi:enoyl-CoA hydratase/carnithine racemase
MPRVASLTYETVLFSIESDVARLTLNRSDKLHSFNVQMHGEVQSALALTARRPGSWCRPDRPRSLAPIF